MELVRASTTNQDAPGLTHLIGSKDFRNAENQPIRKVKAVAKRRGRKGGEVITQKDIDSNEDPESESIVGFARQLLNSIGNKYREGNIEQTLFQTICEGGIYETVKRLFTLSLLAKEGSIGITRKGSELLGDLERIMVYREFKERCKTFTNDDE